MLNEKAIQNLKQSTVSVGLLEKWLNDDYYIQPLKKLNQMRVKVEVTGMEWKEIVEMAVDEDFAPDKYDTASDIAIDGIIAILFEDKLEEIGMDVIGYFTYRFSQKNDMKKQLSNINWNDCFYHKIEV